MINQYIFTVVVGRSGQHYLYNLLKNNSLNTIVKLEYPEFETKLEGYLGKIEHRFRRKYIETNELLGRGKVLTAFDNNDHTYIEKVVMRRLEIINKMSKSNRNESYIDISKFFARGLHIGFLKNLHKVSIIYLVRDPISNMRSFLNRKKGLD